MADFLLELRSEEIPARMQDRAVADLVRLFEAEAAKAGLAAERVESFAGPRRLAILARGLPAATAAVSEEVKGPRADAPEQAIAGFLGKIGLARDQLVERADAKGNRVLFAVRAVPGRATADVLAEIVPAVARQLAWPKSMRWGDASISTESTRWVRPLQGVVALLDAAVVGCAVAGIAAGRETAGHRFMASAPVTIARAGDYADALRAAKVIADTDERRAIVREGARAAARTAGLTLVEDEGLVAENAGLTEWPVPLLGSFDSAFLDVPREVIQLTMRTNQKYFACVDREGALAPAFVCTANIAATDGGAAIVAGNAKVLAARLADARFFWEQDLRVPLADNAAKLDQIVFHEKLGTVADKVERVAKIASQHLFEPLGWPEDRARAVQPLLDRAARLAKADLLSGTVGEFPELQGVIGGHIAAIQDAEISLALRDHYLPAGAGDRLPADEVGLIIGLADRADTLYGFFGKANERPTGSRDPFALRRAALGIIRLIIENDLRIELRALFDAVDLEWAAESSGVSWSKPTDDLVRFIIDRLKVQQREAGVRHDLIDAVFALGGEDDLVRLLARVKALQAFVETSEGADLLAGYRRAGNILRKEGVEADGDAGVAFSYEPEPAERALAGAIERQLPLVADAIDSERFADAMAALAALRAPIDGFFDAVIVNDADPKRRTARLALLARLVAAMHNVADFSKIEG